MFYRTINSEIDEELNAYLLISAVVLNSAFVYRQKVSTKGYYIFTRIHLNPKAIHSSHC